MPIPKPNPKEKESEYINRCVGFLMSEGRPKNQALAICYKKWREKIDRIVDRVIKDTSKH